MPRQRGWACSLFLQVAHQAVVPARLDRPRLIDGNSLLALSHSAAEVSGPTRAAGLIQVLKAPLAIAIDAVAVVAPAFLVARIQAREARPAVNAAEGQFWRSAAGCGIFVGSGALTIGAECRITGNTASEFGGGGILSGESLVVLLSPTGPSPIVVDNCHEHCVGYVPRCADGGFCPA